MCSGKIKDPSGVSKDFKGPKKAMGGSISQQRKSCLCFKQNGTQKLDQAIVAAGCGMVDNKRRKKTKLFLRCLGGNHADSIKSKWNSLNKKGKMIVVVVGVVAIYAISQIV